MLWKAYFDEGYGVTSSLKYFLAVIFGANAIIQEDLMLLFIVAIGYGILCFILGVIIYHSGMKDAMHEVQNKVNPFVSEMRKVYKV